MDQTCSDMEGLWYSEGPHVAYYIRAFLMRKNILYIYKGTYVYLCIKLMHPRMLHKKKIVHKIKKGCLQ